MTWSADTSDGNESQKVRWDVLPYVRGRGLDLGCGPSKAFRHMIGIDAQPFPAASGGADFICDITHLDLFASESMDFIYSSHALEDQVDVEATLREWWRLVRPGGYLVLYLPHKDYYPNMGQPGANPAHRHDFLPEDIVTVMRAVGPAWDLVKNQNRNESNEYSFLQVYRKDPPDAGQRESWCQPAPEKMAAVVRYGAFGDALWASSVLPQLKEQGYHVTVYTQEMGEQVLRHDPHIDRIIVHADYISEPMETLMYWAHEQRKYDKWINLVQSVEARLLPAPNDLAFYLSDAMRRSTMDENYLEAVHRYAELPYVPRQRFYPTAEERAWAESMRLQFPGPLVIINPEGSTAPKWWPYTEQLAAMLAERQIYSLVLGSYRGDPPKLHEKYGRFIGKDWNIRQAMTFAALADVVVGQESALVNATAFEEPLKVVLLSHSSANNLTRDWVNTVAVSADLMPCHPCHRLHAGMAFCTYEKKTQSAGCQAVLLPQNVIAIIDQYFVARNEKREAA